MSASSILRHSRSHREARVRNLDRRHLLEHRAWIASIMEHNRALLTTRRFMEENPGAFGVVSVGVDLASKPDESAWWKIW